MRSLLGITALTLVLLAPATASAATIELRDSGQDAKHLLYTASPGEVNRPLLQRHLGVFHLQDTEGPQTTRTPPCGEGSPEGIGTKSRCPGDLVMSALIELGDRDDTGLVDENTLLDIPVTVRGGDGNDQVAMHSYGRNTLDGGPGDDRLSSETVTGTEPTQDTLIGGDGDDYIRTIDGARDSISCGPGTDTVNADRLDAIAADCESVTLPEPPTPSDPWHRADGRPVGLTIDGAARYTNSDDVTLTVRAPDIASRLRISDDGGFDRWTSFPRATTERYRYRLPSSGPERLPKTAYVRFDGPGLDSSRSFTDDIILDRRRPTIASARRKARTLRLRARDAASGVAKAQVARDRRRPKKATRYRTRLRVASSARWVRVIDRAGNRSRWHRVRR